MTVEAEPAPSGPPSLAGLVVGITADRRAGEQAELLRRMGAKVLHGPTINTLTVGDQDRVLAATADVVARPPEVVLERWIPLRSAFRSFSPPLGSVCAAGW